MSRICPKRTMPRLVMEEWISRLPTISWLSHPRLSSQISELIHHQQPSTLPSSMLSRSIRVRPQSLSIAFPYPCSCMCWHRLCLGRRLALSASIRCRKDHFNNPHPPSRPNPRALSPRASQLQTHSSVSRRSRSPDKILESALPPQSPRHHRGPRWRNPNLCLGTSQCDSPCRRREIRAQFRGDVWELVRWTREWNANEGGKSKMGEETKENFPATSTSTRGIQGQTSTF